MLEIIKELRNKNPIGEEQLRECAHLLSKPLSTLVLYDALVEILSLQKTAVLSLERVDNEILCRKFELYGLITS